MLPLMLSEKDPKVLGATTRSDPMGNLAVWSVRGRAMIPHLTEQTNSARGFQILVEAFRLWEYYERAHPEHAGRVSDFFLLIEQTFARIVGKHNKEWPLPGSRRVLARIDQEPCISLSDPEWHLLDGQKTNGVWGLYRGAAMRAGLLQEDGLRLADDVAAVAEDGAVMTAGAQPRLFSLVESAMNGETIQLPTNYNNQLVQHVYEVFRGVPMADTLYHKLIKTTDLNQHLAERLLSYGELGHRQFMESARDLVEYQDVIENVIRCENLLAVVESVFTWLCAFNGESLDRAAGELPVDLGCLSEARAQFEHSGEYNGGIAATRHKRLCKELDASSRLGLARSVLRLHEEVSKERGRAAWVWEENGILRSEVDLDRPEPVAFEVGVAWRNDYYLRPLRNVATELQDLRR